MKQLSHSASNKLHTSILFLSQYNHYCSEIPTAYSDSIVSYDLLTWTCPNMLREMEHSHIEATLYLSISYASCFGFVLASTRES